MDVDASQATTTLLAEHLQYTPLSLIDDIINSVNNFIYQGVGSLEAGLLSMPAERLGFKPSKTDGESDYPEAKQEIEEGLHKLETLLNSTVDKNFDKFEIYVLRNILSVSADLVNWVRLSHYDNISYPPPQNPSTAESIQVLRRKLAASRMISRSLMQEYSQNEAILQQLRAISGNAAHNSFGFLRECTDARTLNVSTKSQPLTTKTTFTMSQLPALKQLLEDLRPRSASLKAVSLDMSGAKDERRQERREYIEQRTRTQIERNGFLGDSGTAYGKQLDTEEIEALDRVATMFNPT